MRLPEIALFLIMFSGQVVFWTDMRMMPLIVGFVFEILKRVMSLMPIDVRGSIGEVGIVVTGWAVLWGR